MVHSSRELNSRTTLLRNAAEWKVVMQAARNPAAPRTLKNVVMNDTKHGWLAKDGWVKKALHVNGIECHYVYNTVTKRFDDFKIAGSK